MQDVWKTCWVPSSNAGRNGYREGNLALSMEILVYIVFLPASLLLGTHAREIGTHTHKKAPAKMFITMLFVLEITLEKMWIN